MSDPYRQERDPWAEPATGDYPQGEDAPGDFVSSRNASAQELECWRCGKMGRTDEEHCLFCRALLARDRLKSPKQRERADSDSPHLVKVAVLFVLFLIVSIIFGFVQRFGMNPQRVLDHDAIINILVQTTVVEVIDAGLVIGAFFWIRRLKPLPASSLTMRAAAWGTAAPLLLLLLWLNYAYHRLLRDILNLPFVQPDLLAHKDLVIWVIATVCVQPAIIEELFFRYLALGALRQHTGVHGAVVISAVMFGVAHIFAPFSIPILILIGLALGYVRVASGSLILPMLIHFAHNLAVLYIK
jgi:membrane protease YdiL (CAAX protease family)